MKLSIQYLQKASNNNAANTQELTKKVTTTLIEQIEQLSKIAGDFSQFANIGNVDLVAFDISEVLSNLIQLHSAQERVNIEWIKPTNTNFIFADKTQISRLFSNLIINAIEACENKTLANIVIEQNIVNHNKLTIKITDNGDGIDEAMKSKIFTPNFTTKTSGTGLGLAICKGIVEKANGSIYFTTEKNIGTSFIVTLPLYIS
jgi:signal transduction histidine kinase